VSFGFPWTTERYGPIALDVGAHTLRMLQIARTGQRLEVCAAASAPVEATTVAPEERLAAHADRIRHLRQQGHFHGHRLSLTLPLGAARIKNFRLPCMPDVELEEAVRFEALERFTALDDEAQVRFYNAGKVSTGQGEQFELIVLAMPGEVVRRQLEVARTLGLEVARMELAPGALFRCFERFLQRSEDVGQTNAFLDLGYDGARLLITQGPEIVFLKAFDVGTAHFGATLARTLAVDAPRAGELLDRTLRRPDTTAPTPPSSVDAGPKATATGPAEGVAGAETAAAGTEVTPETVAEDGAEEQAAVWDALRPDLQHLGKEVGLCLRYFSVTFRGARPESITCVGAPARSNALLAALSETIGLPLRVGHPFKHLGTERVFTGADRRCGQPEWATALGLALGGVARESAAPPRAEAVQA